MTGKIPRKKVDALYWQGRLRAAQAYLEAAQPLMATSNSPTCGHSNSPRQDGLDYGFSISRA